MNLYEIYLKIINTIAVDPDLDPHSFGCPGSGSGSELGMRIRIHEHEKLGLLPFKKDFFYLCFLFFDLLPTLFSM
jgi:hypothetical protein